MRLRVLVNDVDVACDFIPKGAWRFSYRLPGSNLKIYSIFGFHIFFRYAQRSVSFLGRIYQLCYMGLFYRGIKEWRDIATEDDVENLRQWRSWECRIMSILDFRIWFCECHYQAPYGRVVMGGCPKHD